MLRPVAHVTLVLGGVRSGKSELAERLAERAPEPVTYVATYVPDPADGDMAARIAAHRHRRPDGWSTVEAGAQLPAALAEVQGPALVDSLGTWLAAHPDLDPDVDALCRALGARLADTVVVSEEVGLGVHPETVAGRRFADQLGAANRAVAALADTVLLVVAGQVLPLAPWDEVVDGVATAPPAPPASSSSASSGG
jgi:adenosylcobinamide kinase / adenosylcobinamide-phosphate guanylyltransferase